MDYQVGDRVRNRHFPDGWGIGVVIEIDVLGSWPDAPVVGVRWPSGYETDQRVWELSPVPVVDLLAELAW